jgi:archaellum component FlaF (FlaF/FlaG flagellin family)
MYGAVVDNSSEVISFPQTNIPVTGGIVSGALAHPGVPYTATLDATSAQFATLTKSDRYVTVSVPASDTSKRKITVTVTQNGHTEEVELEQAGISMHGFFVTYEVTALAAAEGSTGDIAVSAPVGHHIEVVTGCPWAKLTAPAATGTPSVAGVTPGICIVPAEGAITYSVKATSANTPADKTDKKTTAPARQANVVVRDITTGDELNVILLQAGGKNA